VGTFQTQRLELETRAKRARDGIRRFDIDSLEIKTAKANEVIAWKAFSWTRLFNTLERVLPYQVRMNSVRPIFNPTGDGQDPGEAETGAMPVSIEGTARSFADLAELQRALYADEQVGRVEPERLDKTDSGEFVFQLRFTYVPTDGALGGDDGAAAEGRDAATPDEAAEVAAGEPESDGPDPAVAEEEPGNEAASAGAGPEAANNAEAGPVEGDEASATAGQPIDREAVRGPAAKAKRSAGPRTRPDPRRRRPLPGDPADKKEDGDQR
jgi:hypothetical protein